MSVVAKPAAHIHAVQYVSSPYASYATDADGHLLRGHSVNVFLGMREPLGRA